MKIFAEIFFLLFVEIISNIQVYIKIVLYIDCFMLINIKWSYNFQKYM